MTNAIWSAPGAAEISDAPSSGQTHELHCADKSLNISSTETDCKTSTELEALSNEACVGTAEVHSLPGVTPRRVLSS